MKSFTIGVIIAIFLICDYNLTVYVLAVEQASDFIQGSKEGKCDVKIYDGVLGEVGNPQEKE